MGLVLGVSPERFSRMPHGATCHWDDHTMPGHAPWDATCHWGLLGGWNVAVSGLFQNPSITLYYYWYKITGTENLSAPIKKTTCSEMFDVFLLFQIQIGTLDRLRRKRLWRWLQRPDADGNLEK